MWIGVNNHGLHTAFVVRIVVNNWLGPVLFYNEYEDGITTDQRIDPKDTAYEPVTNHIFWVFDWRAQLSVARSRPVIAELNDDNGVVLQT